MKFKLNQIYYNYKLDFLFLVTDVDREFNRAKLEYERLEVYSSSWFKELIYIGDL